MTVTVRSFAKINLGLRIGAPRADGFHDLLTVYQTIGLHDVIRISVMRGTGIEIRCADPRVPRDESNTCFRVVEEAIQQLGTKGRVVVEIEKRLPVIPLPRIPEERECRKSPNHPFFSIPHKGIDRFYPDPLRWA